MNTRNVDPKEIDKFAALAHGWWDPSGEMKALHEINPLRLAWIQEYTPLAGLTVVDVGCGGGILSESMAAMGADVLGVDLADKSLKVAQLHAMESGQTRLRYEKIAVEELALQRPAGFDVVTCMEMLEHVPDPASIVAACSKLVKPGGKVFFSTLNRNAKAFVEAIVGAEYVLRLLARGTHEYAKFIKPSELAAFAQDAGLDLLGFKGLRYNPLTERFSLNADTSVNYFLATEKR